MNNYTIKTNRNQHFQTEYSFQTTIFRLFSQI